jgi:hypothetical protein
MIVKCIQNSKETIPKEYLDWGPDNAGSGHIAASVGKYYAVYAKRTDKESEASWYLLYTDNGYLWWMPSMAYEITDPTPPANWIRYTSKGGEEVLSYPSLEEWRILEGIIDHELTAVHTYLDEVNNDPTFPSPDKLEQLNHEFNKRQRTDKYLKAKAIAKENSWELPEKPEDID